MNPRRILDVAKKLLVAATEEDFRSAAGRAYYALMLECRSVLARWGFTPSKSDNLHNFVRLRFYTARNPDLIEIGRIMGDSAKLRNKADYDMTAPQFTSAAITMAAIKEAEIGLNLLDAVNANPAKRAAAITEIKSRWP